MSNLPPAYLEGDWDGRTQRVALAQVCRIGRNESNEIVLINDSVSRTHAMLHCAEPGVYYVHDMGSSNGTFVNGACVATPVLLHHGDSITIGPFELRFTQENAAATSVPQPGFGPTNIVMAQKIITVMVCDIRDFTGLAQRIDPAILPRITGTLFREAGRLLQQRGAWAQKYIGDAVMAVWAHSSAPDAPEIVNVLEALCEVAHITEGLQEQLELPESIHIGASINTGPAVLGNVGSVAASDHTALGETVNRTFRLESMTRNIKHDILLGEDSFQKIAGAADLAAVFEPQPVNLKGYTAPVAAYATSFSRLAPALEAFREHSAWPPP
jgi:adenylate cyclase